MPLYYFDWVLGANRIRDPNGIDLPDEEAARWHAITEIRNMLRTTMGGSLDKHECKVEVCDEQHRMLFTVGCHEA